MRYSISLLLLCVFISLSAKAFASGDEFTGHFEKDLVPNTEDFEKIILKPVSRDKIKGNFEAGEDPHLTASKLIDPRTQDDDVIVLLAEENGESPVIFVDLNGDGALSPDEKHTLLPAEENNPYLWETTVQLKMKSDAFTGLPIFIQYYRSITIDDMEPADRLITQSTEVFAKGFVDIGSDKVLFQYAFDADKMKVDPKNGMLGVDMNSDGTVDMGDMSAESTKANDESVVFRFQDSYFSTKKADVKKDLIVVEPRQAKDYKRVEIYMNKEFPDFTFTDFEGKERKFSEFRGKYVILDIWGFWCPPCREELPYLKEANRRFGDRGLVIVGLNTDEGYTVRSMRKALAEVGMTWTNAEFSSVTEFLRDRLRVSSFPTTFLISPEGKVLSIGRTSRDEPALRGSDLLKSLDEILPAR